jgi:ElaB/YqjD/DUF883 family membrane-anchored ribosome-binding protein
MNSLSVRHSSAIDKSGDAVDGTASVAHQVVDTLADQALTGVGKSSGSLHVAVNQAADAVIHAADWVAHVPAQVQQKRMKLADVAFATIRARPFVTLGSAIAIGFILGRLARR